MKFRSARDGHSESLSSSSPPPIQYAPLKHPISRPPPSFQSSSLTNVKSEKRRRLGQIQKSISSAYPTIRQQVTVDEIPVERTRVKTGSMVGMRPNAEDYDFCQPTFPQPSSSCYQNPFIGGFSHSYQGEHFNSQQDLEHSSPPQTSRVIVDCQIYHTSHLGWNSTISHLQPHSAHQNLHPQVIIIFYVIKI